MLLENNPYPQDVRVRGEAESLSRHGYSVTVLAPRSPGQPRHETIGGVVVRRFSLPQGDGGVRALLIEYCVAHLQLIARAVVEILRGADALHLHNPPDTLFPAGLLAKAVGRRFVFDNHDLFPDLFEEKFGKSLIVRFLRLTQRASMRSADLVIVTNESQRNIARAQGLDALSIAVVRNGPRPGDAAGVPHQRAGALEDLQLAFLGTFATQDGVFDLPEMLRNLRERHGLRRVRLTMIGDGPARADLEREFDRAEVADSVTMTGWVPSARVPTLLAAADVGIDPAGCTALNHKMTMMKIAEYLAAGLPVVAYELTETSRTAQGAALLARCGDDVAFTDNIARMARDEGLRRCLSASAVKRRAALTWDHSERVLIDAYTQLMKKPVGL